jgi:hypothetical protein
VPAAGVTGSAQQPSVSTQAACEASTAFDLVDDCLSPDLDPLLSEMFDPFMDTAPGHAGLLSTSADPFAGTAFDMVKWPEGAEEDHSSARHAGILAVTQLLPVPAQESLQRHGEASTASHGALLDTRLCTMARSSVETLAAATDPLRDAHDSCSESRAPSHNESMTKRPSGHLSAAVSRLRCAPESGDGTDCVPVPSGAEHIRSTVTAGAGFASAPDEALLAQLRQGELDLALLGVGEDPLTVTHLDALFDSPVAHACQVRSASTALLGTMRPATRGPLGSDTPTALS